MRTNMILAPLTMLSILLNAAQAQEQRPGLVVSLYDIGHDLRLLPDMVESELPNVVRSVGALDMHSERGDFGEFRNHFVTRASGLLIIDRAGVYALRLISDDGSRLWIDGRVIINHDGWHGAVPKDSRIHLRKGVHPIRVEHFNNWGDAQLTLQWQTPDVVEPDAFEIIPADALGHPADAPRETAPGKKRVIPALRRGLPGDGSSVAGMHPGFETMKRRPAATDNYKSVPDTRVAVLGAAPPERPASPFVWMPPAIMGYDLTAPIQLNQDVLVGNGRTGETYRIALDEFDGHVQGCAFRFSGGHPQGFNVIRRGPEGELMVARLPENSAEPDKPKTPRAEQFFAPSLRTPFEMTNVRAAANA